LRAVGRRAVAISRIAIAAAIIGAFGTWRNTDAGSLDGLQGPHNGWLVVVFALIALSAVPAMSRGSWPALVAVLGSTVVMIFTAVENVVDDGSVLGGSSGWGVWLTLAASTLLAGAAVATVVERLRPS
jgi:hypothetical protein